MKVIIRLANPITPRLKEINLSAFGITCVKNRCLNRSKNLVTHKIFHTKL